MKCWRCGQQLTDDTIKCSACGASQERTVPQTDIGRMLRKLYDARGAQEVLSSSELIVHALGGLTEDMKKARNLFHMALDAGVGRLYLEQLRTAKYFDWSFGTRVSQFLNKDVGLNDMATMQLIIWFNEMIGWKEKKERPKYKSSKIIGIDLGGSTARAALIEGGELVVVPNQNGGYGLPSATGFRDGSLIVGEEAQKQAIARPAETSLLFKTKMGTDTNIFFGDRKFQPQFLSALVLRKLRMDASDYLGDDVVEAVITVPNSYTSRQRQAVIDAGRMAGLTVKRVINNTSAVALDICHRSEESEKVLVISMGSTSLDVSVMEITADIDYVEVLASGGDSKLGGKDFTDAIVYWILNRFLKEEGVELGKDPVTLARVQEAAETAKKDLSGNLSTQIFIPYIAMRDGKPLHLDYTLTRAEFNESTKILRERAGSLIQGVMNDAGVLAEGLKRVILTGGGSRIPAMRDTVRQVLKKEISLVDRSDDSPVKGAALLGGVLHGDIGSIVLLEVISHSFGIETAGNVCTKLIDRNTTYPAKRIQTFSTAADNQVSVDVHLLEGDSEKASENETVGKFRITDIPPAAKGVPQIEVTFDIDANGTIGVSAKDLGTGKECRLTSLDRTKASEDLIKSGANLIEKIADTWME